MFEPNNDTPDAIEQPDEVVVPATASKAWTGTDATLVFDRADWQKQAACRELDVSVFYASSIQDVEYARSVCAPCTVRGDCRRYGDDVSPDHGMWGGATVSERKAQRRPISPPLRIHSAPRRHGKRCSLATVSPLAPIGVN